jgi:endonuclease YncB( thermonuclease family)
VNFDNKQKGFLRVSLAALDRVERAAQNIPHWRDAISRRTMDHRPFLYALTLCLLVLALAGANAEAEEISGYAFVQDDGSMKVDGRHVRLFGIYIPPTSQSCRTFERPLTCAPRAALALDFRIGADFVHCQPTSKSQDGEIVALCRVGGEDLSAYLLTRGWAVALPDAPFEYSALEKIARNQGVGVWGIPVDRVHKVPWGPGRTQSREPQ